MRAVKRVGFLGLDELEAGSVDIAIISLPYELTSSYGEGTSRGPAACIEASSQVELYDSRLEADLPSGFVIHTAEPWDGIGDTLLEQLDSMVDHLHPWFNGDCFPLVLGGEHGILPCIVRAAADHPELDADLGRLTIVQIDAHADLREQLGGERWSHACAARRALELGVGRILQVGVRAYSREEAQTIAEEERVSTWFARDLLSPCAGEQSWQAWLEALRAIDGPVHLSIDIDGLDGSLVPSTGTPVPGGLLFWHLIETIEALFANPGAFVVSADVNEIVPGEDGPLTQFTAAMIAKEVIASHLVARTAGRWSTAVKNAGMHRQANFNSEYFSRSG